MTIETRHGAAARRPGRRPRFVGRGSIASNVAYSAASLLAALAFLALVIVPRG